MGTFTRRHALATMGAGAATLALWPRLGTAASGADSRLLVLMLRGGLDGLHAVPPYGDPDYARLRGPLALAPDGSQAAWKLDGTFALHPELAFAARLYARGDLLPLVAVALPYRGRSHFDAQDCLENGTATPYGAQTGWLNRAAATLLGRDSLALTAVMPLILRGPVDVKTWSPPLPKAIDPVLLQRLEPLYGEDRHLAAAFAQACARKDTGYSLLTEDEDGAAAGSDSAMAAGARTASRGDAAPRLPALMKVAGNFLALPDGPRIGFVEDYGWDTHANEALILGRKLRELDDAFAAFYDAAPLAWSRTVIVAVTEFGRTAAINGTGGTDHGTGAAMFLAGGAVRGGRVAGQWPGLAADRLYEQRDIPATTDLRSVFKAILARHMGLGEAALNEKVFPGSGHIAPLEGLLRT